MVKCVVETYAGLNSSHSFWERKGYKMPKTISVIVPVYNTGKYLKKCLESIANQSYKDYELVIVNDGSTDNSLEVIQAFVHEHTDIDVIIINQNNNGLSAARNKGVEISRGEYITFIDSDDFIEPSMLSDLIGIANDTNTDIVSGFHTRSTEYLNAFITDQPVTIESGLSRLERILTITNDEYTNTVSVWGKIFKRYIWETIQFPEGKAFEDEAVFHRIMLLAHGIAVVDIPYYHYVNRADSIVNDKENPKNSFDKAEAFETRARELLMAGHPLASEFALKYYAFCVDTFLLLDEHKFEKEKELFLQYYLKNKELYYRFLSWHQKICVLLLFVGGKRMLDFLIKDQFAPGRDLLYKESKKRRQMFKQGDHLRRKTIWKSMPI